LTSDEQISMQKHKNMKKIKQGNMTPQKVKLNDLNDSEVDEISILKWKGMMIRMINKVK
jgi:hypothetical protein